MLTSTALFVTIFIGLLAVGLLRHQYLPQWGKRSASASWPMAKANFLSGAVTSEVVGSEYEVFLTEILFTIQCSRSNSKENMSRNSEPARRPSRCCEASSKVHYWFDTILVPRRTTSWILIGTCVRLES